MTFRVLFLCGSKVILHGDSEEEARAKLDKRLGRWINYPMYRVMYFRRTK